MTVTYHSYICYQLRWSQDFMLTVHLTVTIVLAGCRKLCHYISSHILIQVRYLMLAVNNIFLIQAYLSFHYIPLSHNLFQFISITFMCNLYFYILNDIVIWLFTNWHITKLSIIFNTAYSVSLCQASAVCHRWYQLTNDSSLWKHFCGQSKWRLSRAGESKQLLHHMTPDGIIQVRII